jgi:hypothetical protein
MALKHRIPHDLSLDLARRATAKALDTYRAQFPQFKPGGEWTDADHARLWFSPPGSRLEGAVTVQRDAIELELEVPLLLRPFRTKAIAVIEAEVQRWIAKAKAGELD